MLLNTKLGIGNKIHISRLLKLAIITIIVLGIIFRLINLDSKIYWVDEVSTSVRVSGYTKQEVITEVNYQGLIPLKNLQNYQHPVHSNKTFLDTWHALTKSPEHTPLYFILAKIWLSIWGSSLVKIRALSVIFSILAIICIYWLSQELFNNSQIALLTSGFLAISPLYVTYSQEARPYSLWIVLILLSHLFLLKSLRLKSINCWLLYGFFVTASLYTSLLSFLIVFAQTIYVLLIKRECLLTYLIMVAAAITAFIPWGVILIQNWDLLQENTVWMKSSLNLVVMTVIWIYSISTVFIETPIYPALTPITILRIVIDFNLLIIIFISLYSLSKNTPKQTWLFVLSQLIIPLLVMRLIDLVLGRQASTAIRYMIPSYLFIPIVIAYFFTNTKANIWQYILLLVIFIQLASCIYILDKSPRYQKTRNLDNPVIAAIINQTEQPILLTEAEHILDAISLSYLTSDKTQFQLLSTGKSIQIFESSKTIFVLNPSAQIIDIMNQQKLNIKEVYKPQLLTPEEIHLSLWQVE